ncbi:hypothetical protein AAE478_010199 [Parahypoxylon ruwenzoriense]
MATRSIDGLEALLGELGVGLACDAIQSANIKDNSDLTLILPKLKWRSEKPKDLARQAFVKYSSTPLFQLPIPDGVHLRFIFSTVTLPRLILPYINDRMEQYGRIVSCEDQSAAALSVASKKVVVEFSSPNLATQFNLAHLRSTILGAQIANLYECMGWDVVRLNYLGDWGKEIGLLGVGWNRFGSDEMFEEDPMGHIHHVYEKVQELFRPEKEASRKARNEGRDTAEIERQGIFAERNGFSKRMEDSEPEAIAFWRRIRDATIAYYTEAYKRLNITYDEFSGESQVSPESIAEVETILKAKGIYEESDGSWIIDYSKHGPKSLGVSVLRGRTGSTSYLLRDIAAVFDRSQKYSFDKMVYVVAAEQDVHFQKVFQALRYMDHDDLVAKLEHVNFGKVQGLSQQLGEAHLLGNILNLAISETRGMLGTNQSRHTEIDNSDRSAEILGTTTLTAEVCGLSKRATGYTLDMKKFSSFEGDTGPNLQLCYAKLCSKIKESNSDEATLANVDYTYLQDDPWTEALRLMAQYPDAVDAAYKGHEPSMILAYLFHLAEELNNCLEDDDDDDDGDGDGGTGNSDSSKEEVEDTNSGESPEAILAQAVLYRHARQVLDNGMSILGITPVC